MSDEEKLADYREVRLLADRLEMKLRRVAMILDAYELMGRDTISIETLKECLYQES